MQKPEGDRHSQQPGKPGFQPPDEGRVVVCCTVKKITSPTSGLEKSIDEDEVNSVVGAAELIAIPPHGKRQEEGDSAQQSGSGTRGHETELIFP